MSETNGEAEADKGKRRIGKEDCPCQVPKKSTDESHKTCTVETEGRKGKDTTMQCTKQQVTQCEFVISAIQYVKI